jgi:hypothetical protein
MKKKKFVKRLALNKRTVSTLDGEQLLRAKGGISRLCSEVPELCETYPILQCNSVKPNTGCQPSETYQGCYPTQDC